MTNVKKKVSRYVMLAGMLFLAACANISGSPAALTQNEIATINAAITLADTGALVAMQRATLSDSQKAALHTAMIALNDAWASYQLDNANGVPTNIATVNAAIAALNSLVVKAAQPPPPVVPVA